MNAAKIQNFEGAQTETRRSERAAQWTENLIKVGPRD